MKIISRFSLCCLFVFLMGNGRPENAKYQAGPKCYSFVHGRQSFGGIASRHADPGKRQPFITTIILNASGGKIIQKSCRSSVKYSGQEDACGIKVNTKFKRQVVECESLPGDPYKRTWQETVFPNGN